MMRSMPINRSYQKETQEKEKEKSPRISQEVEEIIRESHLKRIEDS